ncbi:LacI family transcriptional regulator [Clostridium polyendosporum]|uniref:LacI family transcriptional regulator n=1 Tax=Clostridium polyendosporum TaxID=69208 RepID=A0A919VHS7_9CLOT|nr:LacI family DNA-binding transcriptional regulator [Clostridium polyendosporum]GIM30557.1 LacI family transcriptional regulator [Clostridium polyendosporum]
MKKNLTIKDIAEMAGVAKSTVSRYLNNGNISAATSEKIKKVIEANQYEPNAFAQSLKAKRTRFVGIIAPCLDSVVKSKVIMALDDELRNNSYNSLIINTSLKTELEVESLENLARLKVDGIILVATEITEKHKEVINKINIPITIIGQQYSEVTSIINDDYNAGFRVGEYIRECGHKDVVYLGVSETDVAVGIKRKNGVLNGFGNEMLVKITDFTSENAESIVDELLKSHTPTAIICATDKIAVGAFRAIENNNKKVPEDISLIGFGGYDTSTLISTSLTTIKFNNKKMGEMAADTIIKLINGEEVPKLQITEFNFIERNSVKRF